MYSFYETLKEETDLDLPGKKDDWILKRAFELMDWCSGNLSDKVEIDDAKTISELMTGANIFNDEFKILKEDRKKYDEEIEDAHLTEKSRNFKLINKTTKKPEDVNALIYFYPPKSSLTKYWARFDGYIFTLIPIPCEDIWQDEIWKPPGFSGRPNKVIMSVPPEADYNLKSLAIQLERAECEMERRILGDLAELKRTRMVVRRGYEKESWVTNNDPWFDGSSHNNTIVDAPSSLSLLSTKNIISIAETHTSSDVDYLRVNIIYPIALLQDQAGKLKTWKNIIENINGSAKKSNRNLWEINEPNTSGFDNCNYFHESVGKFLNLNSSNNDEVLWYHLDGIFPLDMRDGEDGYSIDHIDKDLNSELSENMVYNIRMACFPSKIGFILMSVYFKDIQSYEIREILQDLKRSQMGILSFLGVYPETYQIKEPYYMAYSKFNGNKFKNLDMGKDVFGACSFMDATIPLTDGSNERARMEKMLFRINGSTIFGFSQNCTMLAQIARVTASSGSMEEPDFFKIYIQRLDEYWLYEWILVLYQQYTMVSLKTRLGAINIKNINKFSKLQSEFVDFISNSSFTQVTSDPTGTELYNRWKNISNLDDLNSEINIQMESLNDHVTSSIQNMLSFISFVFFPMTLLLNMLDFFQFIDLAKTGFSGKILILICIFSLCFIIWRLYLFQFSKQK